MVFWRQAEETIEKWMKSRRRKPLVIRGARQTGKTTLVHRIGERFDTFIPLNLEKHADRRLFENDYSASDLLQHILIEKGVRKQGRTLLFLDEIQNAPAAAEKLRYFYEDLPELYLIAAGSLPEVMMEKKKISFPVGRVQYMYLFPLRFGEFLRAIGEDLSYEYYRETPVKETAHGKLMSLYRLYMFTGGMPEAVSVYAESKELSLLSDVHAALQTSFMDDVGKYAETRREGEILRHVIETAPLATPERIKFEHFGNSLWSSRDIGNACRILERAMLLYLRYPVTNTAIPCIPDKKLRPHLQFIDSGMLCHAVGITGQYYSAESVSDVYAGKLAEQAVGQELLATASKDELKYPYFWTREKKQSNAEIDFLWLYEGKTYPLEVKSGVSGRLRSLHSFINLTGETLALRLYSGAFSVDHAKTPAGEGRGGKNFRLLNLPLYCAGRLDAYLEKYL